MISRLCATEEVSDDEAAGLSMALLFAGHETTVVQIGLGALMLLTNLDQWQALVNDPGLTSRAVEEMLRVRGKSGGVPGVPRYTRTDLEVDGVLIRAGELVLLGGAALRLAVGMEELTIRPDTGTWRARRHWWPDRLRGEVWFGVGRAGAV